MGYAATCYDRVGYDRAQGLETGSPPAGSAAAAAVTTATASMHHPLFLTCSILMCAIPCHGLIVASLRLLFTRYVTLVLTSRFPCVVHMFSLKVPHAYSLMSPHVSQELLLYINTSIAVLYLS